MEKTLEQQVEAIKRILHIEVRTARTPKEVKPKKDPNIELGKILEGIDDGTWDETEGVY